MTMTTDELNVLHEYSQIVGTKVGESIEIMIHLLKFSPYLTEGLVLALENELRLSLDHIDDDIL